MRPVQDGSRTRVQHPQWFMTVSYACQISEYSSVDGSERNGPELEVGMLVNWQPVQLPCSSAIAQELQMLDDLNNDYMSNNNVQ